MYLCFIDESGISPSDPRRFLLVGVCIPALSWTHYERRIEHIKGEFGLGTAEIHAAQMTGVYKEQEVPGFAALSYPERRAICSKACKRAQSSLRKGQERHGPYWHLTQLERSSCVQAVCREFGSWEDAFWTVRVFEGGRYPYKASRYQTALVGLLAALVSNLRSSAKPGASESTRDDPRSPLCLLIHDASDSRDVGRVLVEKWRHVSDEVYFGPTPLFVDSRSTSMLQLADVCAHASRVYLDKGDRSLLEAILPRLRSAWHQKPGCGCMLCSNTA